MPTPHARRAPDPATDDPPTQQIRLSAALAARLRARAAAAYPREACGLLIGRAIGRGSAVGRREIEQLVEARNLEPDHPETRYVLDSRAQLAAERQARAAGLDVVGVWHSHPDHPARPSASDLETAWEGYSYVIVTSSAAGTGELRSWHLCQGQFREEQLLTPEFRNHAETADERS